MEQFDNYSECLGGIEVDVTPIVRIVTTALQNANPFLLERGNCLFQFLRLEAEVVDAFTVLVQSFLPGTVSAYWLEKLELHIGGLQESHLYASIGRLATVDEADLAP